MIAEANGTQIHYVQEGSAGRNIVLLPGLGASTHVWYPQLRALSAVLRVTAMDLRGHGQSACPPGPYSMRQMAEDVSAVLLQGSALPAVVVGSSMAAMVAVELAAAHPEQVAALVLVGGFPVLGAPGKERFDQRARTAETEGMAPLADQVAAAALGATTHATQPGLVGLFRQGLLANDPHAYAAACRAIRDADVTHLLAAIRCPALILLGSEEQVAPLPAAMALRRGLPHAVLQVIPAAGHLPFLEQPAAFNAAVLEFVGGLTQSS